MTAKTCITGAGIICALGDDVKDVFEKLCMFHNNSGYIKDSRFYGKSICIPNKNLNGDCVRKAYLMSKIAVKKALKDADLCDNKARIALCLGTTFGDSQIYYDLCSSNKRKQTKTNRKLISNSQLNSIAYSIVKEFDLKGHYMTISHACLSSSVAIKWAEKWIKYGLADIVVCGGVDVCNDITNLILSKYRVLSKKEMKPFDKSRDGMILGEGAGFLVLESEESALQRSAKIKGYLKGTSLISEIQFASNHENATHNNVLAINDVLLKSKINIEEIDCIFANGLSTKLGDTAEIEAFNKVIPSNKELYITTIKDKIGHVLGASGIINAIMANEAIINGKIPPLVSTECVDEKLKRGLIPNRVICQTINNIMCSSIGFDGCALNIIIGK